jgi:hypothetical protein
VNLALEAQHVGGVAGEVEQHSDWVVVQLDVERGPYRRRQRVGGFAKSIAARLELVILSGNGDESKSGVAGGRNRRGRRQRQT